MSGPALKLRNERQIRGRIRSLGRWPFQPVLDILTERNMGNLTNEEIAWACGWDGPANNLESARSAACRWKRDGLTERVADQIATHLGVHPSILWPDEYNAAIDACEETEG